MLKVGDKVYRNDGSYCVRVTVDGLVPCHGIEYKGEVWTIVAVKQKLPAISYIDKNVTNDTILVNYSGVVLFCTGRLLYKIETCPHCGEII